MSESKCKWFFFVFILVTKEGILIQKFLKHDCMRLDNSWEIQDGVFCEGNFGKNNALYIMVSITNAHGARPTKKMFSIFGTGWSTNSVV